MSHGFLEKRCHHTVARLHTLANHVLLVLPRSFLLSITLPPSLSLSLWHTIRSPSFRLNVILAFPRGAHKPPTLTRQVTKAASAGGRSFTRASVFAVFVILIVSAEFEKDRVDWIENQSLVSTNILFTDREG